MRPVSKAKIQSRQKEIRDEHLGATGKRVLLTEGADDKTAFQILLDRFRPGWESQWALAEAGSKDMVIALLREEPNWIGIVDRDEWSPMDIGTEKEKLANLEILPRYCLESYLIVPGELWSALPPLRQQQVSGGFEELEAAILKLLPRFLRHGALWRAVAPLWAGLRAQGFKEDLASERSIDIAQDDLEIQRKLEQWHRFLDPDAIFAAFKEAETEAAALSQDEQLKLAVHGKCYWAEIDLLLNQLLGQRSRSDRSESIFRNLPALPDDLHPFFELLMPAGNPLPDR